MPTRTSAALSTTTGQGCARECPLLTPRGPWPRLMRSRPMAVCLRMRVLREPDEAQDHVRALLYGEDGVQLVAAEALDVELADHRAGVDTHVHAGPESCAGMGEVGQIEDVRPFCAIESQDTAQG